MHPDYRRFNLTARVEERHYLPRRAPKLGVGNLGISRKPIRTELQNGSGAD